MAELAALPDVVRGYEEIKLRNVETFRARAEELLAELDRPVAPPAGRSDPLPVHRVGRRSRTGATRLPA